MRKKSVLKLLVLTVSLMFGLSVFADTTAELTFKTNVPKAVSIKKLKSGSPVYADPTTGKITGTLQSVFELDSNDTENTSEFIITASVDTTEGSVSAYDSTGNIAFANTESLPTETDVNQALSHSGNNYNVIVYPVTLTTSPFEYTFKTGYKTYGNCYVIDLNGETEGTITHAINSTPVAGTFHKTKDTSGVYSATITLTSVGL